MTCCVSINAKEGDFWIVLSLMSHKFHINHQIVSTESRRLAKERQFLPSSLGHQRKYGKDSFYRAHSVIEENLAKIVSTEITRSSKEIQCLPSSLGLQREYGRNSSYQAGSASKIFHFF